MNDSGSETTPREPITGIAFCCARAANGQEAAVPPRSLKNFRRLITRLPVRLKTRKYGSAQPFKLRRKRLALRSLASQNAKAPSGRLGLAARAIHRPSPPMTERMSPPRWGAHAHGTEVGCNSPAWACPCGNTRARQGDERADPCGAYQRAVAVLLLRGKGIAFAAARPCLPHMIRMHDSDEPEEKNPTP